MRVHFTEKYLLNPAHKVTVNLVGLGGTGSQMLGCLSRLSETLRALDHPGLHVRAWDPDIVTEANLGRQLFYEPDLHYNKAIALVTRLNRSMGFDWEAEPREYDCYPANILITCVDTPETRVYVADAIHSGQSATSKAYYWLDLGNSHKTGQAVLGTVGKIAQPKSEQATASRLRNVVEIFPQLKKMKATDQGPSCSLAEAIGKQDLFINSTLAQFGGQLIWKLFREGMIRHHGCYVNLDNLIVNPMPIT